jgi:putative endonuclease
MTSSLRSAATRLLEVLLPPRRIPTGELGRAGERRAVWFYRWRGYAVVAQNAREGEGEIDLVVRRGRRVAFVEVKTRQSRTAGEPFDAVDARKRQRIARAAERLALRLGLQQLELRFDVLSLYWNGSWFEIEHFPSAFEIDSRPGMPWLTSRR